MFGSLPHVIEEYAKLGDDWKDMALPCFIAPKENMLSQLCHVCGEGVTIKTQGRWDLWADPSLASHNYTLGARATLGQFFHDPVAPARSSVPATPDKLLLFFRPLSQVVQQRC